MLVSIHSFTPVYHGVVRDMELGILHDTDARFADALLAATEATGKYGGAPQRALRPRGRRGVTFTLSEHAVRRGLLNAMIEIRNDLIADADAQQAMADRLSGYVTEARARLPHEVHTAIFDWVLALIAEAGLVKGERIGVDASTMEANAALRNIVRRDTGEGYRGMLARLAQESGIETPTAEELARLDRKRKGKKLSNQDWVSKSDPEAKIAKMKDGTTHLAYKPEHAVDLDTGAVVAAELHPADEGDTTTLEKTLAAAKENLEAVDAAPTAEDPAECVTDKGYHSRSVLKALDDGPWKTRISEPKQKGFARWHGDGAARRAVTNNRTRLLSGVAKEAFKLRAEIVERSFAHNLDRGGMRRTWLRGRENVHKRYLLHVAGHNLSLLMRKLIGAGTPREAVAGGYGCICVLIALAGAVLVAQMVLIVSEDGETAFVALCFAVE